MTVFLLPTFAVAQPDYLGTKIKDLSTRYNVDSNLASKIIYCESRFEPQALNTNTNLTKDHSYWQINNYYWKDDMLKRGLDITNPDDNLEAGFIILSEKGTQPWSASKKCWTKKIRCAKLSQDFPLSKER